MDLTIEAIAARVSNLRSVNRIEDANRFALNCSELLLQEKPEAYRTELFSRVFAPFIPGYKVQYQPYDFEIVDYELYKFTDNLSLVRGPRPNAADLAKGNYAVVLGAAQFFGRLHTTSINKLIHDRFGIPVLNLSIGGAGPLLFANNQNVIAAASRAKFVILQVLSGRSIGCEEYPGERLTVPASQPGATPRDRIPLLEEIWRSDRNEAIRLVQKWNKNYVEAYVSLIAKIQRPVVLAWLSDRSLNDWNISHMETRPAFGKFPQLVSRSMIDAIRPHAHSFIEGEKDRWLPFRVKSRFTGSEAPFFLAEARLGQTSYENSYYASFESVQNVFEQLVPIVESFR